MTPESATLCSVINLLLDGEKWDLKDGEEPLPEHTVSHWISIDSHTVLEPNYSDMFLSHLTLDCPLPEIFF